ncbi:TPA: hypothetical protein N0F65_002530 [Lagenidium giganteum]|uniref:Enoyl reductase (ER) domain-containing protein n=1 Tax=Lagenidium giganteum TaxID=4803 RepID=A0AAV2YK11_9STRA|nr:TPA: hypothetical protein N0F65_002530 [Lagenidium giganteum]
MKAVQVSRFANTKLDQTHVSVAKDVALPTLNDDLSDLYVRVLACAFNAGDSRVMSGDLALVLKPKAFPYIPGMDVCGVVERVGAKCQRLKPGDRIIAGLRPLKHAGMAEYAVFDERFATKAPTNMTAIQAASLPIAGATALKALEGARLQPGAKVVVLGASGGVGSLVVQMVRNAGAEVVVGTSTNEEFVKSLGADQVINYRTTKWYEVLEGQNFDAVIDCVGEGESWNNCHRALASHGRYVAVSDSPDGTINGVTDLLGFIGRTLWRSLNPMTHTYVMVSCFPDGAQLTPLVQHAEEGKLKAVLDASSPYALTTEAVRSAIALQASHRAKGKLVVKIADES